MRFDCHTLYRTCKYMVHDPGSETTATDDDQNSKYHPYATRRDSRSWPDLPLEIPTFLLGRAAVAGNIRGFVQAPFSGAADICRTARRVAKDYRGWSARRHPNTFQRHDPGSGSGDTSQGGRGHARPGLELELGWRSLRTSCGRFSYYRRPNHCGQATLPNGKETSKR